MRTRRDTQATQQRGSAPALPIVSPCECRCACLRVELCEWLCCVAFDESPAEQHLHDLLEYGQHPGVVSADPSDAHLFDVQYLWQRAVLPVQSSDGRVEESQYGRLLRVSGEVDVVEQVSAVLTHSLAEREHYCGKQRLLLQGSEQRRQSGSIGVRVANDAPPLQLAPLVRLTRLLS